MSYIIYLYKLSFAHCKQSCFRHRRLPTRLPILILSHGDSSDEELEEPMKDQLLPVYASPTALSLGYIADFNPEKDEEDPEEDPADYPIDGGDNDDNESSDDD
ncbi:hypothetical protein Tco_0469943, partial [Tanacetum coccineum]